MKTYSPNILVTGGNGQVGQSLREIAKDKHNLAVCSKDELDITQASQIETAICKYKPEVIINTAAYTAVDLAESEREQADLVNHIGASHLAKFCAQKGIRLIHISTDYVFDGDTYSLYTEEDMPNPINYYGRSKLNGEIAIARECKSALILRTSGVFSSTGSNFVKTILRLAGEKESLEIVTDQRTCPTAADDIATTVVQLAETIGPGGIYHYCSTAPTSWHDFAAAILETAKMQGFELVTKTVEPTTSEAFPRTAKRPAYSALCCDKIRRDYGILQPQWRESLIRTVGKLKVSSKEIA